MSSLKNDIPTAYLCRYFDVSRSGFYSWCQGQSTVRRERQQHLEDQIQRSFVTSKKTYGSPRITQDLAKKGRSCSENTVARIMKDLGLSADRKKKFKVVTTDSNHSGPIAQRVFKIEDFNVKGPNEIYAGDITYLALGDKFLYLSVVIDLYSRRVVGWSITKTLETTGVIDALKMAYEREGGHAGVIFHSDRGVQYASSDFRRTLSELKAVPSMSRKGNCYDNAFVETFFKTLKSELIYRQEFTSETELRAAVFAYIETWYNRRRMRSSLGYLSPLEYERTNQPAA